jgi:hypothetical protein
MTREERLTQIREKAEQLNKTADVATSRLIDAERQLVAAGVGMEVWCEDSWEDDDHNGFHYNLGFINGYPGWGLAVKQSFRSPDGNQQKKTGIMGPAIANVPRLLRLKAETYLVALLEQIEKKLAEQLPKAD